MGVYRRNGVAEKIKSTITMKDIARQYGFDINRAGFMQCPFHSGDHTASLKVYPGDRGWHCFGCGKGGSVIDFAMNLFGIGFRQAVLRLNSDFNLGFSSDGKVDVAEASRLLQERAKEKRELEEYRDAYQKRNLLHRAYVLAIKKGEETPLYFEALKNIDTLEYWFDEHPWR